jgi:hypothetical protein
MTSALDGIERSASSPDSIISEKTAPGTHGTECAPKPVRSFREQTNLLILVGMETRLVVSAGRTQYSDFAVG